MEYSTDKAHEKENENGLRYDIESLYAYFQRVFDARRRRGVRYSLATLLVVIFLAKLSGEDRPTGIADWGKARSEQIVEGLHLSYGHMPHANTIRWVLQEVIDPLQFQQLCNEYLQLHSQAETEQIALDGKTMRGTIPYGETRGEHLISGYSVEKGTVLTQEEVDCKENEIVAAPVVLAAVDLRDIVVSGDAMQTQRGLSQQITGAGGDYLFPVKDNQPKMRQAIEQLFAPEKPKPGFGQIQNDFVTARTVNTGHGRIEVRTLTASSMLNDYLDWPGLAQVYRLERKVKTMRAGQVVHQSCEVEYGITSLTRQNAIPARLLCLRRNHWGVESGLHYRRDVTLHEDATRMTNHHAAHNLAIINNLTVSIARLVGYDNLARARRFWAADLSATLSLLVSTPANFSAPRG
jgi:predicted transposase YbfD/YdcC